jgi:hypothetical protein
MDLFDVNTSLNLLLYWGHYRKPDDNEIRGQFRVAAKKLWFTSKIKLYHMIVKESKTLFHLVGIVMSRAGRSGARRHFVIDSWRLEIFTQYNF